MNIQVVQHPQEAPMPRLWQSVGRVLPGVEAFYAIPAWHDRMDIDREADLRNEMFTAVTALVREGVDFTSSCFTRHAGGGLPELVIRYVGYGEEGGMARQ